VGGAVADFRVNDLRLFFHSSLPAVVLEQILHKGFSVCLALPRSKKHVFVKQLQPGPLSQHLKITVFYAGAGEAAGAHSNDLLHETLFGSRVHLNIQFIFSLYAHISI